MIQKEKKIILEGKVLKVLPGNYFQVQIKIKETQEIIEAYTKVSGRLFNKKVRIFVGDNVKVETSEYSINLGKIIEKIK